MDTSDLTNIKNIINNQTFYRAVVEDNNDPKKLNRVKVRIMGIHPEDSTNVPTSCLPWAEVIAPVLFGLSSGIGISGLPNNGSYVWVFFEGDSHNQPIVLGACYGMSKEKQTGGFTDPDGVFPVQNRLAEPDTNRLARNEVLSKTVIGVKVSNREKGVPTSEGKTWSEPEPQNHRTEYPNNTVIETKTGHVIEIDDTPGNERIHIYHRTGTYLEMFPDGTSVNKIVKDEFRIVDGNRNTLVKQNDSRTVYGSDEELISGNQTSKISESKFVEVGGTTTHKSGGVTTIKGSAIHLNP